MKFIDPSPCRCGMCGIESAFSVRDLLALTAKCPSCGAPMKDIGVRMRETADGFGSMVCAASLLMHVENRLGITIPDDPLLALGDWPELTLNDVTTAVRSCTSSHSSAQVDEAVLSAVRSEWPGVPEKLDYTLPLLEAICPKRHSHGFGGRPHELLAEMPIPRSLGETIFTWVITLGTVGFSIKAVLNLLSGEDVIATWVWSSLWFGLVIWQIWQTCVWQGGIRKFAINYLGGLVGKGFAKIALHDGKPTEIWFGFHLGGHRFVQRKVFLEKVESVEWGAGQATALTGRDKKDWQVCMWFKQDDPPKMRSFKPGQEVFVVGPSGRKEDTAIFGLSLVNFLGNAGVLLAPGKGDACFVRSGNNA